VNKAAMDDRRFQALLLEYAPAMDIKLRRPFTPELMERAKLIVPGGLDSIEV
jgi:hypothetical protein